MDDYTHRLWDLVYDLRDKLDHTQASTTAALASTPTLDSIQSSLQSTGSSPLDVTALVGRTMTNQYAYVPKFSPSAPPLYDPVSQVGDGALSTVASAGNTGGAGILYRFNQPIDLGVWQAQQAIGANLIGTHAERLANYPASSYEPGTLFFETDRTVFYINKAVASVNRWIYAAGQMDSSSTTIADIPIDLGANDIGFLYGSTYWNHVWVWLNTGPTGYWYAPGDPGSLYIVASTATAPENGKWGICDGSAYSYVNLNAVGGSITTPDLASGLFVRGGPYAAPSAASRATWEAGAKTDSVGDHHHSVFLSCGSVGSDGSPADAALCGFFFDTGDAGAHDHTLSDSNAQLKVPSDSNGGLPAAIKLDWYVRL